MRLPQSGSTRMGELPLESNCDIPGIFIYKIDQDPFGSFVQPIREAEFDHRMYYNCNSTIEPIIAPIKTHGAVFEIANCFLDGDSNFVITFEIDGKYLAAENIEYNPESETLKGEFPYVISPQNDVKVTFVIGNDAKLVEPKYVTFAMPADENNLEVSVMSVQDVDDAVAINVKFPDAGPQISTQEIEISKIYSGDF